MESVTYVRETIPFEDLAKKFRLPSRDFNRQYAHIYAVRLMKFRSILERRVAEKWGKEYPVRKLVDLKPNERSVVCGTLYKHQELKPSILREISDEHQLLPLPPNSKFVSPKDLLILEDELQRIVLVGNINCQEYVTGVVIALLGHEDESGKFFVEDVCTADLPTCRPRENLTTSSRYVALLSGLDLGSGSDPLLAVEEMVLALTGKAGAPKLQNIMSRISRLIIAGNCLSSATQDRSILDTAKYLVKNSTASSIEAVQQLDDIIFQLASSMPVELMPGAHDPTNYVLPQQPLHHCMLPLSNQLDTFRAVSNPYCCKIGGRTFVGTSGQPVLDIMKNSTLESSLDVMEKTLDWGHLCPTAPDTLGCYPYGDEDPFLFDTSPDIYFAGNQDTFGDRVWKGAGGQVVRIVSIPRFSETRTVVLVDLATNECFTLSFDSEQDMMKVDR